MNGLVHSQDLSSFLENCIGAECIQSSMRWNMRMNISNVLYSWPGISYVIPRNLLFRRKKTSEISISSEISPLRMTCLTGTIGDVKLWKWWERRIRREIRGNPRHLWMRQTLYKTGNLSWIPRTWWKRRMVVRNQKIEIREWRTFHSGPWPASRYLFQQSSWNKKIRRGIQPLLFLIAHCSFLIFHSHVHRRSVDNSDSPSDEQELPQSRVNVFATEAPALPISSSKNVQ
jgi:hypothetical protein